MEMRTDYTSEKQGHISNQDTSRPCQVVDQRGPHTVRQQVLRGRLKVLASGASKEACIQSNSHVVIRIGLTFPSLQHLGRSKVCDTNVHLVIQEDVLWLHVSVNDP